MTKELSLGLVVGNATSLEARSNSKILFHNKCFTLNNSYNYNGIPVTDKYPNYATKQNILHPWQAVYLVNVVFMSNSEQVNIWASIH